MSTKVKNLLRKLLAIIFGGFFLIDFGTKILYDRFSPDSLIVHPVPEFIIVSIIGWLMILVLPVAGAFLLYQNKRSGKIIIGIYLMFILLVSIISLIIPDFFAD